MNVTMESIFNNLTGSNDVLLDGFRRAYQKDSYSCGAVCAAMILRYFGRAHSVKSIKRACKSSPENGTSEASLRMLFKENGLRAQRINKPTLEKIRGQIDLGFPVLIAVDDSEHWVVVYGYGKGCVYLADPSFLCAPLSRHSIKKFRKRWDHWAMVVR